MNICLFTEEELGKPLAKNDERTQHIVKVLNKKEGDAVKAGIIEGQSGVAVITKIGNKCEPDEGQIYFDFKPEGDGKPLYNLKMIIGFPRPIQLKRLLRDVAALGVGEVHLTGTELGEKSYMQSSLVERGAAYQMLLDGTVQAGGTHVPKLFLHQNLSDCVAQTGKEGVEGAGTEAMKVVLDNVLPENNLTDYLKQNNVQNKTIVAAIGSERGWTDRERAFLKEKGFVSLGMGCRIMRTETAATVSASIILSEMGVLK